MKLLACILLSFWLLSKQCARAQDVLIVSLTCIGTNVGPEIEGEVKNISSDPLAQINIIPSFRDASGKFISTADVLAKYTPLLPGQTSTFDSYGDQNPLITNVTIGVALFESHALEWTGVGSATCSPSPDQN